MRTAGMILKAFDCPEPWSISIPMPGRNGSGSSYGFWLRKKERKILYDVIIIGAGPAGIFTALELIKQKSDLKILMLEKGQELEKRICPAKGKVGACLQCKPCSITCGWGGAGAFSDGKITLSTKVGGNLNEFVEEHFLNQIINYVDQVYQEFGAPQKVYGLENREKVQEFQQKAIFAEMRLMPMVIRHMGTERCQKVLQKMRNYLLTHQVEIHTTKAVETIFTEEDTIKGVITEAGDCFYTRWLVVAPGREGAEWLAKEARRLKIDMVVNPVDIGVRVELPAAIMESLTHSFYEAKFIYYSKTFEDRVRTFCMNPYGEVVLENINGIVSVNGHTYAYKKTDNTNFALLVSKTFTEPFKEPIAYGKYVASLANLLGGSVIIQRLGDLLDGRRSTPERLKKGFTVPTLGEATPGDLSLVFPYRHLVAIVEMLKAMDKVVPGVFSRHTLLYGVEVKFYSSRLALTKNLKTRIKNLFAVGDGAGVTRGLAQASASGVMAARAILSKKSEN